MGKNPVRGQLSVTGGGSCRSLDRCSPICTHRHPRALILITPDVLILQRFAADKRPARVPRCTRARPLITPDGRRERRGFFQLIANSGPSQAGLRDEAPSARIAASELRASREGSAILGCGHAALSRTSLPAARAAHSISHMRLCASLCDRT